MEYETKLLEREQKGIQQGVMDTLNLSKEIKNLKLKGFTPEEIYSQIKNRNYSLSNQELKELIDLIN